MKLIIQIPCYNEEIALPVTLSQLPTHIDGIDEIEVLISDDGSTDRTIEIAKSYGVKHIVTTTHHRGLAKTFTAGIQRAVAEGADIIVNTDADNQYCADDIEKLVKPILEKKADIVIGARPINEIKQFSKLKKFLQFLGSKVVSLISSTPTDDVPSGFRAFSPKSKNVFRFKDTGFGIESEMLVDAAEAGLKIVEVPITVRYDLDGSTKNPITHGVGVLLKITKDKIIRTFKK